MHDLKILTDTLSDDEIELVFGGSLYAETETIYDPSTGRMRTVQKGYPYAPIIL